MSHTNPDDRGEEPLASPHGFNEPGEDITLYEGPLLDSDIGDVHGRIQMTCGGKLDVRWHAEPSRTARSAFGLMNEPEIRLQVRQPYGMFPVEALRRDPTSGSVNGQSIGSDETPLSRIMLHWMNLPPIASPIPLFYEDGTRWQEWNGRWRFTVGPWQLTLDQRGDHARVWKIIRDDSNFVMTHVMEVVRQDSQTFTPAEVEPLLEALQFAVSFAFARWIAPALPVGLDESGAIAWRHWAPLHCEPGRNAGLAWLFERSTSDLHDLLTQAYEAFADPDRQHTTQILLAMATESNRAGRMESRILTAFSAIELLSWITLKLTGGMSKSQYDGLHADGRLRRLLNQAAIDVRIDAARQPVLARYASADSHSGTEVDAPTALCRIRNQLVHPKVPQDEVYSLHGLLRDAWLLTRHYLNLLILHRLGYTGSYQTVLGPGGWAGDTDPVPWSEAASTID